MGGASQPRDLHAHPDLAGLGARARDEWRREVEDATADAFVVWTHRRTVADIIRDCMQRGDRVRLRLPGAVLVGVVCGADDDLVTIAAPDLRWWVPMAAARSIVIEVVERGAAPGIGPSPRSGGWRGALLAAEAAETRVQVVTTAGERHDGHVLVGADHISVRDDGRVVVVVGVDAIACVAVGAAP